MRFDGCSRFFFYLTGHFTGFWGKFRWNRAVSGCSFSSRTKKISFFLWDGSIGWVFENKSHLKTNKFQLKTYLSGGIVRKINFCWVSFELNSMWCLFLYYVVSEICSWYAITITGSAYVLKREIFSYFLYFMSSTLPYIYDMLRLFDYIDKCVRKCLV